MRIRPLLEICVETLDLALPAERGGADRIELCEKLSEGGVTPSVDLMHSVRAQVHIPIFAMIRPRSGDFCYSTEEYEQMIREVSAAKECGMDGVVFGLLRADRRVDIERTRALVELAQPLPVTFHRAFDETPHLRESLKDVAATGAKRILTSGGKPSAEEGIAAIAELVEAAKNKVGILPGGGINAGNLGRVFKGTQAREFHSGLSSALPDPRADQAKFEAEVRKLAKLLQQVVGRGTNGADA